MKPHEDGANRLYLIGSESTAHHKMPTSSQNDLRRRLQALENECARLRSQLGEKGEGTGADEGNTPSTAAPDLAILDKAADGIFTLDRKGCITYMNAAGRRMLGTQESQETGQRFLEVLGTMANRKLLNEITQWLRNPEEPSSFLLVDVPVVNRLGDERWLSLHLKKHVTSEGEVWEVQGMARDITDQHRLQFALRRSEEHYRGIIENMMLGILEVDNEERIVRAYPRFCSIVGYSEEELLGRKASEVLMREEDRKLMDERTRQRNVGESGLYEVPIRNKAGEEVWLLISGVPLLGTGGEVLGSMGIHYDITERKRDEKELIRAKNEADAARFAERAFLARMSHEVRTPMNAILGMARLLESSQLTDDQQEFVKALVQGGKLLKGILDNVLDLARMEDGHAKLNAAPVEVKPIFDSVIDTYRLLLAKKGVNLALNWDPDMPTLLRLDRGVLTQILMNLVGNATKFTNRGEVVLTARTEGHGDGQMGLHVEVRDSGRGIPEKDLKAIFERFGQVEPEEGELRQGSGLGLTIVRELCHLHGGEVEVKSEVGKGSAFRFRIAVEPADEPKRDPQKQDISRLAGQRILIAEDNAVNVMYISQLLKNWGVDYTVTTNGIEAVDTFRSGTFDLLLMDVQMPECDGLEATRRIRNLPSGKQVPIVGISAFASDSDRSEGVRVGMDAYLAKPYSPEELRRALLQFL